MRYLLTLLLTCTFACGEHSARPRNKQEQESDLSVVMEDLEDMNLEDVEDMGCMNTLECMSDEEIQDKLLNLLHPSDHRGFEGWFEPVPFEFNQEDEDQKG